MCRAVQNVPVHIPVVRDSLTGSTARNTRLFIGDSMTATSVTLK